MLILIIGGSLPQGRVSRETGNSGRARKALHYTNKVSRETCEMFHVKHVKGWQNEYYRIDNNSNNGGIPNRRMWSDGIFRQVHH